MSDKPKVVLTMPRYSSAACFESVKALFTATRGGGRSSCDVILRHSPGLSLLNHCFNKCWCAALNMREYGATHIAMIHADIAPDPLWLDILMDEMLRLDATMISAVVPIKSKYGHTSTAVQTTEDLWGPPMPRRLTMKEVYDLPETFSSEDVGAPLLLNTGLWVCDIRQPWAETIWFESLERIGKAPDGRMIAQAISEDWLFSARLRHLGAKLYATRKVKLVHQGEQAYTNQESWGEWETDEDYHKALAEIAEHQKGELCESSS